MNVMKQKIPMLKGIQYGAILGIVALVFQCISRGETHRLYDIPYLFGGALGGALIGMLVVWVMNINRKPST